VEMDIVYTVFTYLSKVVNALRVNNTIKQLPHVHMPVYRDICSLIR